MSSLKPRKHLRGMLKKNEASIFDVLSSGLHVLKRRYQSFKFKVLYITENNTNKCVLEESFQNIHRWSVMGR